MINELCFARYIILLYSRACDTERLSNFMTSLKGKSQHYGSPGNHIKIFVIQCNLLERGEVSFFPFFKMNIYYCILQKGKGAKTPTIQAEWF